MASHGQQPGHHHRGRRRQRNGRVQMGYGDKVTHFYRRRRVAGVLRRPGAARCGGTQRQVLHPPANSEGTIDVRRETCVHPLSPELENEHDPKQATQLIEELKPLVSDTKTTVVFACLPLTSPPPSALRGGKIKLGAQNVHFAESGAYTGELSAQMLKEAGVSYVIIGHSERRQYFGETDETVNKRTRAAVAAGLTPIICVGELKEQREAGYTDALVTYQTLIALTGLTPVEVRKVVIAYEPVWAIGTGLTASDEQANETIGVIRKAIATKYGKAVANRVRIQYGGSMKPSNVKGLMAQPEIDGGLIGGASLKAEDFAKVVNFDK